MRYVLAFSLMLLSLISVVASENATNITHGVVSPMTLVVDCDVGADDAMALLIILQAVKRFHVPENNTGPNLLAITTVNGNTGVQNVTKNVLRILKLVNRLDVPVYMGAAKSLKTTPPSNYFFGTDGLGDIPDPETPSIDLVQKEHAAVALVRLARERRGELTLIALAGLTNIAMAIRLDENFLNNLKHLYILGGATEGRGNTLPGVEFNFYMDPEANYAVLQDTNYANSSISLLAWEPTEKMNISLEWRTEVFGKLNSKRVKFLNDVGRIKNINPKYPWIYPDPVLAMTVLQPSLARRHDKLAIVTLTQGEARGAVVVDYYQQLRNSPTVDLISDIDVEAYKSLLLEYFK